MTINNEISNFENTNERLVEIINVVGSRHRRKAIKIGFFLICELSLNLFFFDKYLKITKRYGTKKKIRKHFYTQQTKKIDINSNDELDKFSKNHPYHALSISEAKVVNELNSQKTFNETILEYDLATDTTKDLSYSITNALNKSLSQIHLKLNNLENQGHITMYDKIKLMNNGNKLIQNPIILNEGEKLTVVNINNLTTSPKNSSAIIQPGQMTNGPLSKGLHLYNDKTMIFYLKSEEDFRRMIFFCLHYYKPSVMNYNAVVNTNTDAMLKATSGAKAIEFLKKEKFKDINVLKLNDAITFNNSIYTAFGHLIAEFHKK